MTKKLKWGIIGTGSIARKFAEGLTESRSSELHAVGSRTMESAKEFATGFDVAALHGSYAELLANPSVEAVYVATPHPMHAEWSIKAANAGKHILCEKPLAMNEREAAAVIGAARKNGVFLMEAFMYRCHPQTMKLRELIHGKIIGDVRLIQASFSFKAEAGLDSRLMSPKLGGGGILDVGCYCASGARMIAGAAIGKPFDEPVDVFGAGYIGPESHVDEYAVASMKFSSGIVAQLVAGVRLNAESKICIWGTEGSILVPSPWIVTRAAGFSKIIVFKEGVPEEFRIETDQSIYAIEADHVAEYVGQKQSPAMSWDDSLGNMRTLDLWRKGVGMIYEADSGSD